MLDRKLEDLKNGFANCIDNARLRNDGYDVGYMGAMLGTLNTLEADLVALLPGPYYMDPPDGGDVSLIEQLKRMAADAAKYREMNTTPFGHVRSETPFPAAATMVIVRPEEYAQFEAFRRGEREAARAVKDAMQETEYWRLKYEKATGGRVDTTQFKPCSHPDISYCDESCVRAIRENVEQELLDADGTCFNCGKDPGEPDHPGCKVCTVALRDTFDKPQGG